MSVLLALDIDGVLNSGADNAMLYTLCVEHGMNYQDINDDSQQPYRFFKGGDFVNTEVLAKLQKLVKDTEATVIGISSWFNSTRCPDDIGRFLGIDIDHVLYDTGGGEGRVSALTTFLAKFKFDHLIVLDDQPHYYEEYGYEPWHVKPVTGMTDEDFNRAYQLAKEPLDMERLLLLKRLYKIHGKESA